MLQDEVILPLLPREGDGRVGSPLDPVDLIVTLADLRAVAPHVAAKVKARLLTAALERVGLHEGNGTLNLTHHYRIMHGQRILLLASSL